MRKQGVCAEAPTTSNFAVLKLSHHVKMQGRNVHGPSFRCGPCRTGARPAKSIVDRAMCEERWYITAKGATPKLLAGMLMSRDSIGQHVGGARRGQVLAIKLHCDEVHGKGVFVQRQKAVLVHVGNGPGLVQDG